MFAAWLYTPPASPHYRGVIIPAMRYLNATTALSKPSNDLGFHATIEGATAALRAATPRARILGITIWGNEPRSNAEVLRVA